MKILILNGPNLNMLGKREPGIYGTQTFGDLEELCKKTDPTVTLRQTNYEGELVTWIQHAPEEFEGLIINAGGLSHTSVALLDALLSIAPFPIIEVHLTIPANRETFRHHSFITPAVKGVICGFGIMGYCVAIQGLKGL